MRPKSVSLSLGLDGIKGHDILPPRGLYCDKLFSIRSGAKHSNAGELGRETPSDV